MLGSCITVLAPIFMPLGTRKIREHVCDYIILNDTLSGAVTNTEIGQSTHVALLGG